MSQPQSRACVSFFHIYCLCKTSFRLLPAQIPLNSSTASRKQAGPHLHTVGMVVCSVRAQLSLRGRECPTCRGRSRCRPWAGHLGLGCCALPREPQRCHSRAALRNPEQGLQTATCCPGTLGEPNGAACPGGTRGSHLQGGRPAGRWRRGAEG